MKNHKFKAYTTILIPVLIYQSPIYSASITDTVMTARCGKPVHLPSIDWREFVRTAFPLIGRFHICPSWQYFIRRNGQNEQVMRHHLTRRC